MNPLDALKDIHAAPNPGFWPLAPGWWVLAALLIVVVTLSSIHILRWHRRRQLQQKVMNEFKNVLSQFEMDADTVTLASQLSLLIKRLMLARGERQALGLSGEKFLNYLDEVSEGAPFSEGVGRALLDAPYRQQTSVDGVELYATVFVWAQQQVRLIR